MVIIDNIINKLNLKFKVFKVLKITYFSIFQDNIFGFTIEISNNWSKLRVFKIIYEYLSTIFVSCEVKK